MRYFLKLAYNGKDYHGWQSQPNARSIQETVENVLAIIFQNKTEIIGAGRTDAGVHASTYFCHFDAESIESKAEFFYKMNSMLPFDIAVSNLYEMKPEAHARFDAISRSYQYNVIQEKDPFHFENSHFVKNELDVEKMNQAAAILREYSDFKCFSKSKTDVRTYNCRIDHAEWKKEGKFLVFHITADRFLRNMVRAIVGTLLEIGLGKMEIDLLPEIIAGRDRQKAGTSAPAKALFLTDIQYPDTIFI